MKRTAIAGAGIALLPRLGWPFSQSVTGVSKFAVPLPGLGPTGIPVLTPNTTLFPGTDYYEIEAAQFTQQLHPAIPTTTFWGYADAATKNHRYLGGVIVAKRGTPVKLKVTNLLPARYILPVDPTLLDPGEDGRTDKLAVHLHGGLVEWLHDGGPYNWYSNANNPGGFVHGSSFLNGDPNNPGAAIYDYPNDQSARLVWYHDHAHGITRTNAYAGIASGYLITDDAEGQLISSGLLPNLDGYPLGIPLIIQDKTFWDPASNDPGYASVVPAGAAKGSLWYPHIYEGTSADNLPSMLLADYPGACGSNGTGRWELNGGTPPPVSTVAEFFADTTLVNGAPYPTVPVPRRKLRFRLLNGSNARFYNLQLYVADSSPDGITLASTGEIDTNGNPILAPQNQPGPAFIQIGNEAGFLPAPAVFTKDGTNKNSNNVIGFKLTSPFGAADPTLGNANRYNLLLAPAERADVIIDFRGFEGQKLILYNDAPAPFPGGDIRNDYYGGDQDLSCIGGAPSTTPGYGPDTRVLMRFEVGNSGSVSELDFAQTVAALRQALPITFKMTQPTTSIGPNGNTQVKTLNEDFDSYGRLRQRLGAPVPTDYLSVPTEVAYRSQVQQWQIFNFTGDVHPMHFHLVNVNIRKREQWAFTTAVDGSVIPLLNRKGMPYAIPGTARAADANEQGWKETVRMNPGEVITVNMKFTLPSGKPPPFSPRLQASFGIKGFEYVWHCHILEHEEHDMMHALVVI